MKKRTIFVAVCAASSILLFFVRSGYDIKPNTAEARTLHKIQNVFCALIAYKTEHGLFPPATSGTNYGIDALQGLIRTDGASFNSTDSQYCFDEWMTPFHVEIRGVSMGTNEFDNLFGKGTDDIMIWSSGRNKINEYGQGDDIVNKHSNYKRK